VTKQRGMNRFVAFLEETYNDGTWEYGDGEPMTEDIHALLTNIAALEAELAALRKVARKVLIAHEGFWEADWDLRSVVQASRALILGSVGELSDVLDVLPSREPTATLYVDGGEWGSQRTDGRS